MKKNVTLILMFGTTSSMEKNVTQFITKSVYKMIKPITILVWIRPGKNVSVFRISRSFQGIYVIRFPENRVSKDRWKNVFKSQKRNVGSTLSQFQDIFQEENADQYQEKFVKKFLRKSLEWYKDICLWIIVEGRNQRPFLTFSFEKKASL